MYVLILFSNTILSSYMFKIEQIDIKKFPFPIHIFDLLSDIT